MRWQCPVHEVEWTTADGEEPKCWAIHYWDGDTLVECDVKPEPAFETPAWAMGYTHLQALYRDRAS